MEDDRLLPVERERLDVLWRTLHQDIRRRGIDSNDADDVTQEAWLRTLRHPPRRVELLRHWLRVVGLRVLGEVRRSDRSRSERERRVARIVEAHEHEPSPESRVLQLVQELPSPYRDVLTMRYVDDLEAEEIARTLGSTPGTVRSQLKRGLDRLRVRLKEDAEGSGRRGRAHGFLGAWFAWRSARRSRWARFAVSLAGVAALVLLWTLLWLGRDARDGARTLVAAESPAVAVSAAVPQRESAARASEEHLEAERAPAAGTTYVGTVRDPGGLPVAGATIWGGNAFGKDAELVAISDEAGRFRAEAIEMERFLWATHPGWLSSRRSNFTASRGGVPADLELRRGQGELTVLVRQASQVLPGMRVELDWGYDHPADVYLAENGSLQVESQIVGGETDEMGRIALPTPARSEVHVRISAPGRVNNVRMLWLGGGNSTLELELPPQAILTGTVRGVDGEPAAHARVEVSPTAAGERSSTETDEHGAFTLALDPGTFVLRAREAPKVGQASCRLDGFIAPDERRTVELVLDGSDLVSGLALAAGKPLANAGISCKTRERTMRAYTDLQGRFALHGLARDDEVSLQLFGVGMQPLCELEGVHAGDRHVVLSTDVEVTPGHAELEFVSQDSAWMPTLAELRCPAAHLVALREVDSATGGCSLPLPWGESGFAYAWAPAIGTFEVESARLGESGPQRIQVPRPGRVSFRATLPAGVEPGDVRGGLRVEGFGCTWIAESRGTRTYRELVLDAHGSAETSLFPGTYRYFFLVSGRAQAGGLVNVEEGESLVEPVRLEPGVETTVTIPSTAKAQIPVLAVRTAERWFELEGTEVQLGDSEITYRVLLPLDALEIEAFLRGAHGVRRLEPGELGTPGTSLRITLGTKKSNLLQERRLEASDGQYESNRRHALAPRASPEGPH